MAARDGGYMSFLLGLWCIDLDGKETWRMSLEVLRTGKQRGFANLELMVDFLMEMIRQSTEGKKTIAYLIQRMSLRDSSDVVTDSPGTPATPG